LAIASSELTPVELLYGVCVEVKADDGVFSKAKTLRHVAAHLAKSNDSEFHNPSFALSTPLKE
jgi:hypothetical protein